MKWVSIYENNFSPVYKRHGTLVEQVLILRNVRISVRSYSLQSADYTGRAKACCYIIIINVGNSFLGPRGISFPARQNRPTFPNSQLLPLLNTRVVICSFTLALLPTTVCCAQSAAEAEHSNLTFRGGGAYIIT